MRFDDEKIIEKAQSGDKKSFGILVKKYQQLAFNLAFRILCNEDDARDVVQESFVKIWKNIKNYNPGIKFTTWMYKIVTNTSIDHQRAESKKKAVCIDNIDLTNHLESDNPEFIFDNRETGQLIKQVTETLSDKQRLVFVLRDLQGKSPDEVCEILNLSLTTIKSNLYHARKSVKEKLQMIFSYERRNV